MAIAPEHQPVIARWEELLVEQFRSEEVDAQGALKWVMNYPEAGWEADFEVDGATWHGVLRVLGPGRTEGLLTPR